jgi:hypothetical protein
VTAAPAFTHHPHAARLLLTYARAETDLTWSSLTESAERVEICEEIAAEIRSREDDWEAQLLTAVEEEDAR